MIPDKNLYEKKFTNSSCELVPNFLFHFSGDAIELAMSLRVTDDECRQYLAFINNW